MLIRHFRDDDGMLKMKSFSSAFGNCLLSSRFDSQHISFYASHPSTRWFIGFLWHYCRWVADKSVEHTVQHLKKISRMWSGIVDFFLWELSALPWTCSLFLFFPLAIWLRVMSKFIFYVIHGSLLRNLFILFSATQIRILFSCTDSTSSLI